RCRRRRGCHPMFDKTMAWFSSPGFMPHGYCLQWDAGLLWSMILSNAIIGLAYYSIPVALVYFLRQHREFRFNWIFGMFAMFIFACGTGHFADIASIWYPIYRLDAMLMVITAVASILTALLL